MTSVPITRSTIPPSAASASASASTSTSSTALPQRLTTTAVSAPGKVLLAGGYLVVDRAHTGLVFGLSARIHVHVCGAGTGSDGLRHSQGVVLPLEEAAGRAGLGDAAIAAAATAATAGLVVGGGEGEAEEEAASTSAQRRKTPIVVRSPQFGGAEWKYWCRGFENEADGAGVVVEQDFWHSSSPNKFIETTLVHALSYISTHTTAPLEPCAITILADSDYYSQATTSSPCAANADSPFVDFNVAIGDAHKTGLGSSAALVTALTAALVLHHLPDANRLAEGSAAAAAAVAAAATRLRIHNLAQTAHCTAQGKIGSGFDVAAAVFGSCSYRRFSPAILESLGAASSRGFRSKLKTAIDEVPHKVWDTEIDPTAIRLPTNLRLVMCDVDCGSETPGMVKKVFEWRKKNPERASSLWAELQKVNEELAGELGRLAATEIPDDQYGDLRSIIVKIRSCIREMSIEADVPIEPAVQTDLLDACSRIPGVIGGVVPGAGGFDALAFLIVDSPGVLSSLAGFVETYKAPKSDHGASIGKVRLLGVRQEMEGIRKESAEMYRGWLESK